MPICPINKEMAGLFLDLAKTYHGYADGLFTLFISVLLGSFAFASGLVSQKSSRMKKIGKFSLSSHSLATSYVLLSFYVICFLSFRSAIVNAQSAAQELVKLYSPSCSGFNTLNKMLGFQGVDELSIILPQIGFILGSAMGILVFLYLSNVSGKAGKG